jgi:murein DD-endopeptidase MepM/ murein hydrolase activator NlpD
MVAGRNPEGLSGYGVVVIINHGFGFQTLYAHMNSATVRKGQHIKRGEQIGTVGSSGMSSGSHLHYEVILNGKKVDPVYYFFNDLTPEEYDEVLELARQENQSMS